MRNKIKLLRACRDACVHFAIATFDQFFENVKTAMNNFA